MRGNQPNYASEIKARVSMTDILNNYGFHLVMGRMPCPFHNGKDRNLSIKGNRSYRCWVCGEAGDQITFVQRYFGLDFQGALAKINRDFNLGLQIGENQQSRPDDQILRQASERKRLIEERKREATELRTRYDEALEDYCTCDTIMTRCRPISPSSGISDVFAWAAKNRDRLWYELKCAEIDLFEFGKVDHEETALKSAPNVV